MDRGTRDGNRRPMPLSPKDLACGTARELRTDQNRFHTEPQVRTEQKQREIQIGSGMCGEVLTVLDREKPTKWICAVPPFGPIGCHQWFLRQPLNGL